MRKISLFLAAAALVAAVPLMAQSMMQQQAMQPQAGSDLTKYGYPDVLATLFLVPGQSASITVPDQYAQGKASGSMTISIPANAFSDPVRFELLAAPNSDWQSDVAPDLVVVANFAYRVTDLATGQPVESFSAPLTYSVTDPMITADSVYWATTASSPIKLIDANKTSKISGDTLVHATPVASVGWIVTTPKQEVASNASMEPGSASYGVQ